MTSPKIRTDRSTLLTCHFGGIALFEYLLQVPANRIGHQLMSVSELKILQEVITLWVFVPFALIYLKEPLKPDYLWPGLCLIGAAYFMFRSRMA